MDGRALVAWNIKKIRVSLGVSQERLAFDSGVDRSYLGGLERGEQNPTLDVLDRLVATLGVPISALFVEPDSDAERPASLRRGRKPSSR
jgi:transcriptional regulator with XRE-family HTH domain